MLSGLLKAIIRSTYSWAGTWFSELSTALQALITDAVLSALDKAVNKILETPDETVAKSFLITYTASGTPLSSSWLKLRVVERYDPIPAFLLFSSLSLPTKANQMMVSCSFQQVYLTRLFKFPKISFAGYDVRATPGPRF